VPLDRHFHNRLIISGKREALELASIQVSSTNVQKYWSGMEVNTKELYMPLLKLHS